MLLMVMKVLPIRCVNEKRSNEVVRCSIPGRCTTASGQAGFGFELAVVPFEATVM
jgi:hypothetical protein